MSLSASASPQLAVDSRLESTSNDHPVIWYSPSAQENTFFSNRKRQVPIGEVGLEQSRTARYRPAFIYSLHNNTSQPTDTVDDSKIAEKEAAMHSSKDLIPWLRSQANKHDYLASSGGYNSYLVVDEDTTVLDGKCRVFSIKPDNGWDASVCPTGDRMTFTRHYKNRSYEFHESRSHAHKSRRLKQVIFERSDSSPTGNFKPDNILVLPPHDALALGTIYLLWEEVDDDPTIRYGNDENLFYAKVNPGVDTTM